MCVCVCVCVCVRVLRSEGETAARSLSFIALSPRVHKSPKSHLVKANCVV